MTTPIGKLAQEYLTLRQALETLEQSKAEIEAQLKEALYVSGGSYVLMGNKIALVQGERPKYDTEALMALVNKKIFGQVTKIEIDGKKFKSAVELGLITPEVAESVTTTTPYTQLRVTQIAGETSGDKATTKVA